MATQDNDTKRTRPALPTYQEFPAACLINWPLMLKGWHCALAAMSAYTGKPKAASRSLPVSHLSAQGLQSLPAVLRNPGKRPLADQARRFAGLSPKLKNARGENLGCLWNRRLHMFEYITKCLASDGDNMLRWVALCLLPLFPTRCRPLAVISNASLSAFTSAGGACRQC